MAKGKQVPLQFSPTADFAAISIVRGVVSESGNNFVVQLAFPYDDFKPDLGWHVRGRGVVGMVTAERSGSIVHCSK